jgi:molybdopterin synthase sulfur carrier subunit
VIQVRYFAGARSAAGMSEETIAASSLDQLVAEVAGRSPRMPAVLAVSSFLVDGVAAHDRAAQLPDGCVVDILPPFAGG